MSSIPKNTLPKRNPWVIAGIALIFSPSVGMCYVNRGLLALIYLMIEIALSIFVFICISNVYGATLIVNFIGSIHCFRIAKKTAYQPLKWYARWWVPPVLFFGIPIGLAFCVRIFLYEPFRISSASMSPSLNRNDYIFAEKFAYNRHAPQRGDIIIFRNPKMHNTDFIKRIVGMPGERVQIKQGIVYIDDAAVIQKKEEDFALYYLSEKSMVPQFTEVLPQGSEYRIIMDSPNKPDENTQVYTVPEHSYFVLGDYRTHSVDSRAQNIVGFVAEDEIVGKATGSVYNYDTGKFNPAALR